MKKLLIFIMVFNIHFFAFSQQNITEIEYYFDTEPSIGNGTSLSLTSGNTLNETYNFDISSLNTGFHFIYLRAKNDLNIWGLYDKKVFYISEPYNATTTSIVSAEYYFDSDPGVGSATEIVLPSSTNNQYTFDITTSNLTNGEHLLFIRVKNNLNIWSLYDVVVFTVDSSLSITDNNIDDTVVIYPNPIKDKIYIDSKQLITSYKIIDVAGKTVLENKLIFHSINANMLKNGAYFLILKTEKHAFVKKIIKQ